MIDVLNIRSKFFSWEFYFVKQMNKNNKMKNKKRESMIKSSDCWTIASVLDLF